jgi:hypothetical protein
MASSEWRIVFLEGSAPALPKNFRRIKRCAIQNYRRINSALIKSRHQPLAEASGMEYGLADSTLIPLHACTLAPKTDFSPQLMAGKHERRFRTRRGLGTRDGSEMNWEGEAPAEPKRQRLAIGE